ncbi:MAG: ParB/RepB/Spo0J family partition protein [Deltaproteobacteria bacterium]|nr:ParB/RepB/Spo0J family partition protein [Deltaproteobacteria bacterium]
MPQKGSLGKGLGAILPDFLDDISTRPSFILCGIEELSPNRFQSRKDFNDNEQKSLVASVRKNGIIQPIIVRKSRQGYEIIAGERRWRAAQVAGIRDVPIVIRDVEDSDAAEMSLIENIQREDLNSLEEAEAFAMLIEKFNLSQEELSTRVGKDRSTIANTIRLLKLPQEVKQALRNKTLTAGHARSLLALDSPAEQITVFHVIKKKSLSVRDTERLIQNRKRTPSKTKSAKRDPSLLDLENTLSSRLMTAVHVTRGKKSGRIEIRFNTAEELHRLVTLLTSI